RALPGPALVESGPAGYRLALSADAVDATRFDRLARAGHGALVSGDAGEAARLLRDALALWRGPALADAGGQPWAAAAAARLDERRLAATEDRLEAELALGRHADVLAEIQGAAARHPLRERLQGLLVRALYAAGRQADALAAYEEVRRRLADELGVDPSPALAEVHLRVLRADPGLTPAPRGAAGPPTNLPAQLTSFVGRDGELAGLADQMSRHRLVTLVGPGGGGKTRLAVEAAARALGRFPDGIWLAELAPVTGADDVPQAVLGSVGLREPRLREEARSRETEAWAPRDALSRLVEALGSRRALLVLDNCEHLVAAAASTAGELLARCPRLQVLATSREPLGITGEALAPVAPLGLPPLGPSSAAAEALEHPAVRLFADRAAAVRPGFTVDETTVGPAVEVCRRLDGLPLAIELAAARMRSLPVQDVAARLDDRFRLLTGGSRTALPRHQTLRAVVAWSWDLLSESERRLADRLAVFPGGLTAESAAQVCAGPDLPAEDVPDLLAALVDKSLLQPVGGREPRYRMLETLREYGLEQLAAADAVAAARRAHAAHFLALAEEAEPHLRRPEQVAWIARLTAERDNLLAAMRFATDVGDADTAIRMGAALAWYWTLLGHHAEAATLLGAVADLPGEAPPEARAVCLVMGAVSSAAAWHDFAGLRGRMEEAKALAADSWAEHPMLGLVEPVAAILGDEEPHALALLAVRPESRDPWARATRHFLAAMLYENEGRFDDYRDSLKRALEGYREVGERWGLANSLASLGSALLAEGRPRRLPGRVRGGSRADGGDHRARRRVVHPNPAGRGLRPGRRGGPGARRAGRRTCRGGAVRLGARARRHRPGAGRSRPAVG
ncbi:MAG TPA: BTAD domain-containing putative transcriptional regulator, partial [Mycobacteriales bacterium]|nr:BTAD domain-containing putative transcriptional regulator [Mycobacteriales bacterium]